MHGMLHHVLLVVDRHICFFVRNVETVVMRQDIGVIVYSSFKSPSMTVKSHQSVIEVLLITAIVIEERMEQRVDYRSSEYAIPM